MVLPPLVPPWCISASLKRSFSNKPQTVGNPAVHNTAIKNQVGRSPAAVASWPPLHEQPI